MNIPHKIILFLIFVTGCFAYPPSLYAASYSVWTTDEMERVGKNDPAKTSPSISLFAAKGEYESYQVVVRGPAEGLSNVNVTTSDLKGPNDAIIPATSMTLYREHYVYVTQKSADWGSKSTNRPLGPGWFADGLIPFVHPDTGVPLNGTLKAANATVPANTNQPYWVDILIPRTAVAGTYTGTYTVTSNSGQFQGNVTLTVWNFTLPLQPSLYTSFQVFHSDGAQAESVDLELVRNKLSTYNIENVANESMYVTKYGLNALNLRFWSGADNKTCVMNPPPSVSTITNRVNSYKQPGVLLYNHSADEIDNCPEQIDMLKQWARNLHQAGGLQLITMTPDSRLYDDGTGRPAVDIWSVLPTMYDDATPKMTDAIARGMQVWSYNALIQDSYSPKWILDFHSIDFRIMHGFIGQSLNLTGTLYWSVDLWTSDPWNNPMTHSNGNDSYAGEGMLVYPGAQIGIPNGAAPSMRLKWLREGVEDYEYVDLLKKQDKESFALNLVRTVAPDWKNWSHDPARLEDVRLQLGNELSGSLPTPTLVATTNLTVTAGLHGIGKGGDNTNPSSAGNMNPLTPQRQMTLKIFNDQLQQVAVGTGTVSYSPSAGTYSGTIPINSALDGSYIIKANSDFFLTAQVPGVHSLRAGQTLSLPKVSLINGDSNNDNRLDILDHNMLLGCFSDLQSAKFCTPSLKKSTDFTDDGNVNAFDYNLFLRELSVINGQ